MVEGIGSQYSDMIGSRTYISRTCNLSGKKRKWKDPALTDRSQLPHVPAGTETLRDRHCNSHFSAVDVGLPNAATL